MNCKTIIKYRETSKNDPTSIVLYALDGCNNFVPSEEGGLVCQSCGCHRQFHKRGKMEQMQTPVNQVSSTFFSSNPSTFALPPPPPPATLKQDPFRSALPLSSCPPLPPTLTQDSSIFTSPPDPAPLPPQPTLKEDNTGATIASPHNESKQKEIKVQRGGMKRTRTKFTTTQKDQMEAFANKINWGFRGQCKEEINQFCSAIGVTIQAFQIWISNHKSQSKAKQPDS